mgnify:CR=1 FL=1
MLFRSNFTMSMKVVCWNIRGLKDARKLHRIKSFLSPLKANIIVLTESHANTKTTPLLEKTFLDYQVISTSCSTTPFQGVSALISRDIEVSDILLDHEGRWLRLKAAKGTIAIRLCAVYAPAKIGCREVWFKNNLPLLTKNTDLLLGDFNCILDPATDKFGGSIYKGRQGASVLQKAIMEGGLVDIYHLNKVTTASNYTWISGDRKTATRIDKAFIHNTKKSLVTHFATISQPRISDHNPICFALWEHH